MAVNVNNNNLTGNIGAANNAVQSNAPAFKGKPYVLKHGSLDTFLKSIPDKISSSEQRLIMGITALFSQPFIDLNNKRVNEETRLMSFSRTLAKIVVGTTVGVLVRKSCIGLANRYTEMIPIAKRSCDGSFWGVPARSHSFLSPDYVRTYTPSHKQNYVNTLGTVLGVVVSLFTNFLIDAPLTQIMTNAVYSQVKKKKDPNESHENLLSKYLNDKSAGNALGTTFKPDETVNKIGASDIKVEAQQTEQGVSQTEENKEKVKKLVSFCGDPKTVIVPILGKYIPKEGVEPIFKDHRGLKRWIWTSVAVNPGSMLMHTGALGWAASSAAQITGMAFNEKIDTNKKKFLIPQEAADATGNILLYYGVTMALKNFVERLFEKGKVRIQSVVDVFEKERKLNGTPSGLTVDSVFQAKNLDAKGLGVLKNLEKLPDTKAAYLKYKNGASILATIAASVISCNILTPYFRNYCAAYWHDKLVKQNSKIKTAIFDMERRNPNREAIAAQRVDAFKKFIV